MTVAHAFEVAPQERLSNNAVVILVEAVESTERQGSLKGIERVVVSF
jgi:hypothetical protein